MKLLFEKIKRKKEKAAAEKILKKETSLEERKEIIIFKGGTKSDESGLGGDLKPSIDTRTKPQGEGQNVKKIIHRFEKCIKENYRENYGAELFNNSPSKKFQKGRRVDKLKKIECPMVMKKAVSPVTKRKLSDNLSRKFSKLSKSNCNSVEFSQDLSCSSEKKRKSQKTILDIWGLELSKDGPRTEN